MWIAIICIIFWSVVGGMWAGWALGYNAGQSDGADGARAMWPWSADRRDA